MSLLTLLTGKQKIAAIDAYKAAELENAADMKVLGHWLSSNPSPEVIADLHKFGLDPWNIELGESICRRFALWEGQKDMRVRLAQAAHPLITEKILGRLKPAAKAVFVEVLERVEAELIEVREADRKRAARYSAPFKPSAEAESLAAQVERLKNFVSQMGATSTIGADTIRSLVNQVIAQ